MNLHVGIARQSDVVQLENGAGQTRAIKSLGRVAAPEIGNADELASSLHQAFCFWLRLGRESPIIAHLVGSQVAGAAIGQLNQQPLALFF